MKVPFFRPYLGEDEIAEVVETLRSGWLTTGPRTARFTERFAEAVGARHAVAVNSATAALHLAVEALGLRAGQAVLVPTLTFAATAEVVRYQGAVPILVDCDPVTLNMDLEDAELKLGELARGTLLPEQAFDLEVVGMIPVHVGGHMMDLSAIEAFAERHGLWVVEDAAHAFPSAWRKDPESPWRRCGEASAAVSCFSFYANKTITTGEGGMAVTDDPDLADRIRIMSLHGLSRDAWKRYAPEARGRGWDYEIIAPGYKYNMTDLAAAIGLHQLDRAEAMRLRRQEIARYYTAAFRNVSAVETPAHPVDRIHSWHLYVIRLSTGALTVGRDRVIAELADRGIGTSVHWRPLHLHPYYLDTFGWRREQFPRAGREWSRMISLPLFPSMRVDEIEAVVAAVTEVCQEFARRRSVGVTVDAAPEAAEAAKPSA